MPEKKIQIVKKSLTEKQLLKLINRKSESDKHDYKRELDSSKSKDKYEFVKDVAAFSNARGGYIVLGISDDYKTIGLKKKFELSSILEFLESYFGFPINIDHIHCKINKKMLCLIYIPAVVDRIITCPKSISIEYRNKQKTIIHKNDVFFRRGTTSAKATTADYEFMMEKINYFENKKTFMLKKELKSTGDIKSRKYVKELQSEVKKLLKFWSKLTNFECEINKDGQTTLINFLQYFSVEEIKNAMRITFSKDYIDDIEGRFRYFCGIIHNWKSEKFNGGERNVIKRAKKYFQSKPRGSGYFVEDKFRKYTSLLDWEEIKIAIDETFSERRSGYFKTLCDILDNKISLHSDSEGIKKITCGFCEGTGVFPDTATSDEDYFCCDVCNGKGIIAIKSSTELVKCKFCNGSGKKYDDGYFLGGKCEACKGLGVQPLYGNIEILR